MASSDLTKNISAKSESSFVGPTVISTDFYASTEPAPQRPFQYQPISKADGLKWSKFVPQTADLLRRWNFDFQSVDILNVKHTNGTSLQPRLKIGVSSTKDRSRWKEIIILSYRSLSRDTGFSHFGLDVESPNPNSIFAVEPNHPFVTTWSGLRDKVVQLLQSYEWRALDVFLYGETIQKAEPAIFITMKERSDDAWPELQRKIRGVVGEYAEVEKRGGKVQEITTRINDTNHTGSRPHQAYASQIHGGWGIGVDDTSTGTLGGFVKLRDSHGGTTVYGLTNYHVVRPEMPDFPAGIDRGVKGVRWPQNYSYAYSPSEQDFVEEKRFVKRELESDKTTARLYPRSVWRSFEIGETLTDEERQRLEYLNSRIDLFGSRDALLKGITDDDRRLGKVAYYAGFRVEDGFRLDWALVEVEQGRIGLNRVSYEVLYCSLLELKNNSFQYQRRFPPASTYRETESAKSTRPWRWMQVLGYTSKSGEQPV